jgi:tetratricopeptide (TPR) repeat protein
MALRHMNVFLKKNTQSAVILVLAIVTLVVYWPVRNFSFINYDDDEYVYENPHVQSGLTVKNILWAFQTSSAANWHPVTWLSLMLDTELFGHDPGGYHITNLFLHVFNVLLLFIVLLKMTNAPWRSAFVSCLFALHPLHVESVAWISERKDLLSTFFMLLSFWTYNHYVTTQRPLAYFRTLIYFALGLMSKPMLVTLPFVLLLLDYWPLGRFYRDTLAENSNKAYWHVRGAAQWLFVEKIPFLFLSIASCCITLFAQKSSGAVADFPLDLKVANAAISYLLYLRNALCPTHLAFFYPFTPNINITIVAISILALGGISFVAIKTMRRIPWFFTGWFWYLATLVPVIGIVQVGSQSMADRYTYIPLTGIFIIFAWGISYLSAGRFFRKAIVLASALFILLVLSVLTRKQVDYWQDSATLFRHALIATDHNYVAHNNLGKVFYSQNMLDSSLCHFSEALKISPHYSIALYNTGYLLKQQGKTADALPFFQKAILFDPNYTHAYQCMGEAYELLGNKALSMTHFRRAIALDHDYFPAWFSLSKAFLNRNALDSAIIFFDSTLVHWPTCWEAHYYLGVAYLRKTKTDSSFSHFSQAMRLNPASSNLCLSIGEELFNHGRVALAISLYSRTLRLAPENAKPYLDRAIAFTIENKLDSAVSDYQNALRLKPDWADAHFYLCQVFNRMGRRDSATIHLREADRINPQNSEYGRTLVPALHCAESSTTARGGGLFDAAGSRENKKAR